MKKGLIFLVLVLMVASHNSAYSQGIIGGIAGVGLAGRYFESSLKLKEDLELCEEIGTPVLKGWEVPLKLGYGAKDENGYGSEIYLFGGTGRLHSNKIPIYYMGIEAGTVQVKGRLGYLYGLGVNSSVSLNGPFGLLGGIEVSRFASNHRSVFSSPFVEEEEETKGKLTKVNGNGKLLLTYNLDLIGVRVGAGAGYNYIRFKLTEEEEKIKFKGNKPWRGVFAVELLPLASNWGGGIELQGRNKDNWAIAAGIIYHF